MTGAIGALTVAELEGLTASAAGYQARAARFSSGLRRATD